MFGQALSCPGQDLAYQGRCISPAEQQVIGPTLCTADEYWDPNQAVTAQGKQVTGACVKGTAPKTAISTTTVVLVVATAVAVYFALDE